MIAYLEDGQGGRVAVGAQYPSRLTSDVVLALLDRIDALEAALTPSITATVPSSAPGALSYTNDPGAVAGEPESEETSDG